jgi:hypothetical protein
LDFLKLIQRPVQFEAEAHRILGKHESARSRVVLLEDTYKRLEKLNLKQDDLLRQAIRCAENGLYRAAVVMSWAALMDFLEETLASDNFAEINLARPKWSIDSLHKLRENYPEAQIIDALKDIGLLTKNQGKALQGMLNSRNECAHPSDYYPDLNIALGYISEVLNRLSQIRQRLISP